MGQPAFWRPAKNWTKKEFIYHLRRIIDEVHRLAAEQGLTHVKWRFAFDNPGNHKITEADLDNLLPGEGIIQPPTYSPEIMQPIEHSHAWTVRAYQRRRLESGRTDFNIQAEWDTVREAFWQANTKEVVAKTVKRVPEAARQIIKANGGRINRKFR